MGHSIVRNVTFGDKLLNYSELYYQKLMRYMNGYCRLYYQYFSLPHDTISLFICSNLD